MINMLSLSLIFKEEQCLLQGKLPGRALLLLEQIITTINFGSFFYSFIGNQCGDSAVDAFRTELRNRGLDLLLGRVIKMHRAQCHIQPASFIYPTH